MNSSQKGYIYAWRKFQVCFAGLLVVLLSSSAFAQSTYDAGFMASGRIQICGYNGACSDTGGTFASDRQINEGAGYIKITNAANPLGISINIGHPAMPVPAGWTAGTGGGYPTPPTAGPAPTVQTFYYCNPLNSCTQPQQTYTTPLDSALAIAGQTSVRLQGVGAACTAGSSHCTGPGNVGILTNNVSTCSPGYSLSAGACTLSNANLVPYPAAQDCVVQRTGNTFTYDSRNPGCDTGGAANTPAKAAGLTASASVASATAAGKSITVTAAGDASVTIEITVPSTTGAGSVTKTYKTAPTGTGTGGTGNDSAITGTAVGSTSGVGTLTGTGGSSQTQDCGGTPCATEATLAALKNNVAAGVKQDEQGAAWSTERTTIASAQTTAKSALDALKGKGDTSAASGQGADLNAGLGNLSLPSTAPSQISFWSSWFPAPATCAPVQLSATGRFSGLSMDMCPVINVLRPVLEWGLFLMVGLVIYQRWFGGGESQSYNGRSA